MRRRRVLIAGVSALLAGGLAVAGVTAATADRLEADDVISALAVAPTAADRLPATVPAGEWGRGGLVVESIRSLGSDGPRRFWAATDASGSICVIVAVGDAGQTVGGACGDPAAVAKSGQGVGVSGIDGVTWVAYLLPDGVSTTRLSSDWKRVGGNLVVARGDAGAPLETLTAGRGDTIELRRS